jgi:lipopolysaccharide transport system permease protein
MSAAVHETLILEAGRTERHYWRELWRYRDLFLVLAWRDVAVHYKQTIIGLAWAVLRPFATMMVFTFVFGRLANLPAEGNAPYALMVFAGLLPWQFFSTALSESSGSLVDNSNLIGKVYFPRLIIHMASVFVALVDFLVTLSLLAATMAWYRFTPSWQLLALPLFVVLAFLASLGPGLWLTAMNVKYRDFRYVLPFVVQLGLYVSPVGFSSSLIPDDWRLVYSLNPMVGVIDGFRWAVLGDQARIYLPGFAVSCSVIVILLFLGLRKFRAMERAFADLI